MEQQTPYSARTRTATMENESASARAIKSVQWVLRPLEATMCYIDCNGDSDDAKWYSEFDYKSFRRECAKTAKKVVKRNEKIKRKMDTKENPLCERGIEHRIYPEVSMLRCQRRATAVETVLEEQKHQRYFGTFSSDFLAELYREVAAPSRDDAHSRGLQDEQEARTCFDTKLQETNLNPPPQQLSPSSSTSPQRKDLAASTVTWNRSRSLGTPTSSSFETTARCFMSRV